MLDWHRKIEMRISVVASELPHPQGTAAGRDLWAWCEGVLALGHELEAWLWYRSPSSPEGPVPGWCHYEPVEVGPLWRAHLRALLRPRHESRLARWEPPPGSVVVADHVFSAAAVTPFPRSVATLHYRTFADALAVRQFKLSYLQTARAERFAGRRAELVLAYSERVGSHLRKRARVVPIAHQPPPDPLPPLDAPVAALMADWSWPPNRRSLTWLLEAWPRVREAVPSAQLLLAGRWLDQMEIGHISGVVKLGEVKNSTDLLQETAVVAFPCPTSSGPKVKVLEALAYGVPVVTTPAGAEGIMVERGQGAVVVEMHDFADALAKLLVDPERRAGLGDSGRRAVVSNHSPLAAARARLDAFANEFGA